MFQTTFGRPGISNNRIANYRNIFRDGNAKYMPQSGGLVIDATACRNPFTTRTTDLQPGLILGQITSSKKFANSFLGVTSGATLGTDTTITLTAVQATELVRRIGSSGTFKLVGPPTAAGVVRTATVTYSAVNTTTGVVTMTAIQVNEVHRIDFDVASTGGNLKLQVYKADGVTPVTTANAAWSATDATYLANINTQLDAATGVAGGIVASAIPATDTDLGILLTYSGTGFAGNSYPLPTVELFPTSSTKANYSKTTAGVGGAFVTGSLISPTDGSETPVTFIGDGLGQTIDSVTPVDLDFPLAPISGVVDVANFLPWPADASTKTFIRDALHRTGASFMWSDKLSPS